MKRFLILFILAISVLGTSAQSVEGLIRQYRHEKHADYVHIPRLVMSMARLFVKEDTEDAKVIKAVSSIRVLGNRQRELPEDTQDFPTCRVHARHLQQRG